MLKISLLRTPNQCRLMLEGRLVAPWTFELQNACEKAKADLSNRQLVIDLRSLTAISQEGERVLLELLNQGVKFRCSGVFTKLVMKQLAHKTCQRSREKKR